MKNFVLIVFLLSAFQTFSIKPEYSIEAKGNVTDILYVDHLLYIATDVGLVEVFDTEKKDIIHTIKVPVITDFYGDQLVPKIYDIDYNKEKQELLIVSQGMGGFSYLYSYSNSHELTKQIDIAQKMMIKQAHYYKENDIILGLLSNEIIRYDMGKSEEKYRLQVSSYTFSDLSLSHSKERIVSTDESGRLNVVQSNIGKLLYTHKGENLDNVYQIDYKGNTIATAGQDRKLGIYHVFPFTSYHIESPFLIYCVSLSPNGSKVGYSANEDNEIQIIDTKTKEQLTILSGHQALINHIEFVTENELFTSADEKKVYFWKF